MFVRKPPLFRLFLGLLHRQPNRLVRSDLKKLRTRQAKRTSVYSPVKDKESPQHDVPVTEMMFEPVNKESCDLRERSWKVSRKRNQPSACLQCSEVVSALYITRQDK